uniref:Uncharacterized protein n=1 Tax=viral metagenome TaxID=1070528 RepID=A0A6C0EVT0_9ZZZZ
MNNDSENILFFLNENNEVEETTFDKLNIDNDIDTFLLDFHKDNIQTEQHISDPISFQNDDIFTQMKNYDLNFNVKQLLLICDYYGLSKDVKVNKLKKQDVIEQIILFENNTDNIDVVIKRKEMWYFMNELKHDKFMKKFIIWS